MSTESQTAVLMMLYRISQVGYIGLHAMKAEQVVVLTDIISRMVAYLHAMFHYGSCSVVRRLHYPVESLLEFASSCHSLVNIAQNHEVSAPSVFK